MSTLFSIFTVPELVTVLVVWLGGATIHTLLNIFFEKVGKSEELS